MNTNEREIGRLSRHWQRARHLWIILLTLTCWLVVFAGGLVIDTSPYRQRLGSGPSAPEATSATPRSGDPSTTADEATRTSTTLSETAEEQIGSLNGLSETDGESLSPPGESSKNEEDPLTGTQKLWSWLVVVICFTPTNVAILCCSAGVLGAAGDHVDLGPDEGSKRRLARDQTHPFLSAVVRSFCVYLLVISGTIILMANPFANPTQEFYVRLAGLVSLISFVASYDPAIFLSTMERFHGRQNREPA